VIQIALYVMQIINHRRGTLLDNIQPMIYYNKKKLQKEENPARFLHNSFCRMERGVVDPSPTLASVTELSPKLVESHSQADPSPTLASVIELSPKLVQSQSQATRDVDHEWWRGAVIYQIYVRSFQDHNGDGVGDLIGVIERLEYVASLGVDAIWVSPFFRSPMKDFGYDVASYRQVDPLFGTLDDFDRLLEKAHSFGLKVIIDMVLSHTSDKHEWFVERFFIFELLHFDF
jgi:pullulanase/glycogen debranching enzyme